MECAMSLSNWLLLAAGLLALLGLLPWMRPRRTRRGSRGGFGRALGAFALLVAVLLAGKGGMIRQ